MKKFYALFLIATLSLSTVNAQAPTNETSYDSSSYERDENAKLKCSLELDYLMYDDEGAFGGSLVLGGLVFSGDYLISTKDVDGIDSRAEWHLGLGLNKRIHIVRNRFFFEGRIGASYRNTTIEYSNNYYYVADDGGSTYTDSGFGLYAYPRINLALIKNTCVTVGYKFDFADFKLSEEYMSTCLTLGLSFLF